MLCLGIESTAHTFGIGIVDSEGKIYANKKAVYKPEKGGIEPIKAANFQKENAPQLLEEVAPYLPKIDLVSFSQGPGLPPCLKNGLNFASALSKELNLPLIGVNHCIAHIEIGKMKTGLKDPIIVYVSGGNTQIIGFSGKKYRVFGETLDIGIGNSLDKFARESGIPFPGGPKIEEIARKGTWIDLPYTVKGMDLVFSGLTTEAIKKTKAGSKIQDVCFSLQETAFSMLTEVAERALAHTEKSELLLTGGVAANLRLQDMMRIMCEERGAQFAVVPKEYAGDNGAMIAWQGILESKTAKHLKKPLIKPNWRTDDVVVKYM